MFYSLVSSRNVQVDGHGRRAFIFPYPPHTPSLLVQSLPFYFMHVLLTFSFHLTTCLLLGLSFAHIHFLHKLFILLSLLMTKPPSTFLFTHSTTLHFTPFVQCSIPHFSYMLILLSSSYLVKPHAAPTTHFHSMHS